MDLDRALAPHHLGRQAGPSSPATACRGTRVRSMPLEVTDGQRARLWYQSFTDPDVDAPYFRRLGEYIQSVTGAGFESVVHGIQPGDRYLHPITEFRCAAQVIANALAAQEEGYDAVVIGHFQEPALR